jgi:Pectate lyase superfamily protein
MPVPTTINDLSIVASSNYPAGSELPSVLDDSLRAHAAFIAKLRDDAAVIPTNLASQTNAILGAGLVGFYRSITGFFGRTVSDKLSDSFSVKDFGATGNGVTDDTSAIQAALNSGAVSIFVPAGRYRVTANLTRNGHTYLHGETMTSSVFVMEGTSSFIYNGGTAASEYNTFQLHIERCSFEVPTYTNKTVLDAQWTAGIGGTSKTLIIRDFEITGTNDSGGFGKGIRLVNARNVVLDSIRILGDRDASPILSGIGISIEGTIDGAPVELYINKVEIYFVTTACNILGWVEGLYFSSFTVVACHVGISATATLGAKPLISVLGSHINTDTFGIQTSGFVQVNYSHNLIYAGGASLDAQIMDNNFQGLISGIAKNALVIQNGTGSDNCIIGGNIISSYDTGIILAAGTSDCVVLDTNTFKSCVRNVLNLGATSNRNCVVHRNAGNNSKTYPDGLIEKFGSTVISLNASGNGLIPLETPFPSEVMARIVNSGDSLAGTGLDFCINAATSNLSTLGISVRPNPGAINVRVDWNIKGF